MTRPIFLLMAFSAFATLACCNSRSEVKVADATLTAVKKDTSENNSCGTVLPATGKEVNDFSRLFTPEQANDLTSIIDANEQATTNEIAIITADSAMLGKCTLEEYAVTLGTKWGIGKKEKNNGIVIAICKELRKITIRNGEGIAKIFSDAATQTVIDEVFIPEYKKDNYFEGTRKGLLAVIERTKP